MRTSRSFLLPALRTALSSHELGQPEVYTDEVDESAYVRLVITDANEHDLAGATHLAVWTTTPWTLLRTWRRRQSRDHLRARRRCRRRAELVESVFGAGVTPSATFPVAPWRACTTNVPSRTDVAEDSTPVTSCSRTT